MYERLNRESMPLAARANMGFTTTAGAPIAAEGIHPCRIDQVTPAREESRGLNRSSRLDQRTMKRAGRRGDTLLEMALVLVPLMALIFGITDFGFAIFLRNAFQHSVREGVRYAVTYRTVPGMGHDASIKSVVQTNAVGMLAGPSGASQIRIRYYLPDTLVETPNNWPGNLVEVSIENYQWRWMAPLLRSSTPIGVTVRSMDRMEGLPGGTMPPAR
jgi:hypothetical protein